MMQCFMAQLPDVVIIKITKYIVTWIRLQNLLVWILSSHSLHWVGLLGSDQSKSLGIAGIGVDPNLMKNKGLGSVPKSYVCDDCDHSKTSIILSSQKYQRNNFGIGVPPFEEKIVWDKSWSFHI